MQNNVDKNKQKRVDEIYKKIIDSSNAINNYRKKQLNKSWKIIKLKTNNNE